MRTELKLKLGYLKSSRAALGALLIAGLCAVTATAALAVLWNSGPALLAGRSGAAAVVLSNGSIVVLGGVSANPLTVNTLAPGAAAWTAAPALQNSRYAPGAVASGNLVTVIGGRGSNNRAMKEVMTYDPATGKTSGLQSLITARYLQATANGSGGIYAIGGRDDTAVPLASGGLLSRLRRMPTLGALTGSAGAGYSLTDDAVSTIEARALWSRFGL